MFLSFRVFSLGCCEFGSQYRLQSTSWKNSSLSVSSGRQFVRRHNGVT